MAYYSESGYCAEEEARRPYAEPPAGFYHGGEGGERYAVVRKEYEEEVDEVARAGRGHYGHGGHGHLGHSGSSGHRHVHAGGHEASCHGGYHLGEHREQHLVHGHGHGHGHGGRLYDDACESKRYDSCTGQYYA